MNTRMDQPHPEDNLVNNLLSSTRMTVDSLVALLAREKVGLSESMLSSAQQSLHTPSYLVYLSGLVLLLCPHHIGENYEEEDQRSDVFTQLQTLHETQKRLVNQSGSRNNDDDPPLQHQFRWSPRLIPSPEALERIKSDLVVQRDHVRANQTAKELLHEEEKALSAVRRPSRRKKKRHSQPRPEKNPPVPRGAADVAEDPAESDEEPSSSSETEKDSTEPRIVLTEIVPEANTPHLKSNADSEDWIPVPRKKNAARSTKESSITEPELTPPPSCPKESNIQEKKETCQRPKEEMHAAEIKSTLPPCGEKESLREKLEEGGPPVINGKSDEPNKIMQTKATAAQSPHPPVESDCKEQEPQTVDRRQVVVVMDDGDNDTPTCSKDATPTIPQLQDRIAHLEQQLIDKEKQLQTERMETEERLQAVQLRLYISETRLKTYQDAFEQHVQAVTQNVASSSNLTTTTPTRGSGRPRSSNPEQDDSGSGRLYSRALAPKTSPRK